MQTNGLSNRLRPDAIQVGLVRHPHMVIRHDAEVRGRQASDSVSLATGIYATALRQIESLQPLLAPVD